MSSARKAGTHSGALSQAEWATHITFLRGIIEDVVRGIAEMPVVPERIRREEARMIRKLRRMEARAAKAAKGDLA